jgi:hypothetical protein
MNASSGTLRGGCTHAIGRGSRTLTLLGMLALVLLGSPQALLAGAAYHSNATVNLDVTGLPAGVTVTTEADSIPATGGGFGDYSQSSSGSATKSASSVGVMSVADGTTAFPPISMAYSSGMSEAVIVLENNNAQSVGITYGLSWNTEVSVSSGGPNDFASAEMQWSLAQDGVILNFLDVPLSASNGSMSIQPDANTFMGTATIPTGRTQLVLQATAIGSANSVPEPSSLVPFCAGIGGLFFWWVHRRKGCNPVVSYAG